MKKNYLIVSLVILLFSFNSCFNTKVGSSIKGRWYYVENKQYKEIHANDSLLYIFDWSNFDNKSIFNRYYIKNDSLWSQYYFASQLIEKVGFHSWGRIINFTKDSIVLNKDTTKTVFYKIDDVDSLFTKKLDRVYNNHKKDTLRINQWISYQGEYEKRMIDYYKRHPEFTNRGNRENN